MDLSYPYNVNNFFTEQPTTSFSRGAMLLRLSMLIGTQACIGIIIHHRNTFSRSILSNLILNRIKMGRCSNGKGSLSHFAPLSSFLTVLLIRNHQLYRATSKEKSTHSLSVARSSAILPRH